jgi:hypothetical protein
MFITAGAGQRTKRTPACAAKADIPVITLLSISVIRLFIRDKRNLTDLFHAC